MDAEHALQLQDYLHGAFHELEHVEGICEDEDSDKEAIETLIAGARQTVGFAIRHVELHFQGKEAAHDNAR